MKKIISVFLLMSALLTFTACKNKSTEITPVTTGITFSAELTYYNECYECDASVNENGELSLTLTSPDTLKGLTFKFLGDDITAELDGLQYKTDISKMPEGTVCTYLYEILRHTAKENTKVIFNDNSYFITGNTGKIKYKMLLGQTGLPIYAEDTLSGFSANFKNVTIIN